MPDEFAREVSDYGQEIASRIYSRYQSILDVSNAVDFDDLLLKTFILLYLFTYFRPLGELWSSQEPE